MFKVFDIRRKLAHHQVLEGCSLVIHRPAVLSFLLPAPQLSQLHQLLSPSPVSSARRLSHFKDRKEASHPREMRLCPTVTKAKSDPHDFEFYPLGRKIWWLVILRRASLLKRYCGICNLVLAVTVVY